LLVAAIQKLIDVPDRADLVARVADRGRERTVAIAEDGVARALCGASEGRLADVVAVLDLDDLGGCGVDVGEGELGARVVVTPRRSRRGRRGSGRNRTPRRSQARGKRYVAAFYSLATVTSMR